MRSLESRKTALEQDMKHLNTQLSESNERNLKAETELGMSKRVRLMNHQPET